MMEEKHREKDGDQNLCMQGHADSWAPTKKVQMRPCLPAAILHYSAPPTEIEHIVSAAAR